MECNRDEASRAKEIAEMKFSTKDIMGARKFALKAQSLYPGLDGISQLLAILDVYVAAENKVNGELDFYGILGVSPIADEDTVRKHYRKLALSLHPDKNKSVGADGAFKYVSEAWSFLSDKAKRSTYDRKRNVRVFKQKVQTQNGGSQVATPPGQNGFNSFTKRTTTRTKATTNTPRANTNATTKTGSASVPSPSNKQTAPKTFWTVCKRCKLQYEYLRMYVNRKLLCPSCHQPFLAIETPPPNTNGSSEVPKNPKGASKNVSNPGRHKTAGVEPGHFGDSSNYTSFLWGPFSKTTSPAAAAQATSMVQRAYERAKREREEAQATTKSEETLRRKISKKAGNFPSHGHLNSAKRKQIVDGFGANKETRPVGSSVSSGQVEVTKDISNLGKNRLMKKATMEIRNKLHEWSSETVEDSTFGGVDVMEKADMREQEKSDDENIEDDDDVQMPDVDGFSNE